VTERRFPPPWTVEELEAYFVVKYSRKRLSFWTMPRGGNWSAPGVIAALAGLVQDWERTAKYERNDDNDSYYGSVHCNLPAVEPKALNAQTEPGIMSVIADEMIS